MKKLLLALCAAFVLMPGKSDAQCTAFMQYTLGACPQVFFFDGSTTGGGDFIVAWQWDFGDGNTSTLQNPSHTYTANGNYIVCLTIVTASFCTDVYCDTVPINCITPPGCNADFQYTLGACPAITFFDGSTSSPGTITSWAWDFGDGNTSTIQNPTNTYTANGTYIVCLTIGTSDACTSTYCDTLVISCISQPSCQALFQYTLGGCPSIFFGDASSASPGSIVSWFYDFGDGNTSTLQNPTHTYSANGNYLVCLTIVTSDACTDTYCDTIPITCIQPPSCNADFLANAGNCPAVTFADMSTSSPGTIVSWFYDFGDGNTSTLANPTHTYTVDGTYIACLTIVTSDACTSTYCDTIVINCLSATCNAQFQYTFANCPSMMFFDGSTASPGSVSSWAWDFGDGGASTMQNPVHTYTANGTYLVCLTITTSAGCSDTYCDTLVINCIQQPSCNADFLANAGNCPAVTFADMSTSSPGTIVSWFYDFGDGNTSTLASPTHTYTADGTYIACLTIWTSDSCTSTYCDTIVINCLSATCNAQFQYTLGACPDIMFFDASTASPGSVSSWAWDFGDGGASTMQNPTHTYTANGTYLVCLTITSSAGCSDTYCDSVLINCIQGCPPPTAAFTYTSSGLTFNFTDASTSVPGILSWVWDFGDGNTATVQNPSHTYATQGFYTVCLTVTDSCGTATVCDTVNATGVGINSLDLNEPGVDVYPNPNDGNFNVSISGNGAYEVRMFNALGQEVNRFRANGGTTSTVSLDQVEAGVYFIRVTDNKTMVTRRIVIR